MGKVSINGSMAPSTMENGNLISLTERASTIGQMAEDMKVDGRRINYMLEEYTHGRTAGSTMESMTRIRSMDLESTFGQMAKSTKATGETANSMDRVDSQTQQARVALESGRMVKEKNGFQAQSLKLKISMATRYEEKCYCDAIVIC